MRAHAPLLDAPRNAPAAPASRRSSRLGLRRRSLGVVLALAATACQGLSPIPKTPDPTDAERARFVRMRLEDARAFQAQGRLDSAADAVQRALAVAPDDARSLRLLAAVEAARGDDAEAARLRARADLVDPPPPPPPDTALVPVATGVLAVLIPPEGAADAAGTAPLAAAWPDRAAPAALAARLRTRLPKAGVTEISPASVAQARAWLRERDVRLALSLRVERASCGASVKDGAFAVAQLTATIATPDALVLAPSSVRETDSDPPAGPRCAERALARALERVLARPGVREAIEDAAAGARDTGESWPSSVVRPLFPGLSRRIAWEQDRGRARMAAGRLAEAEESFARAEAVDPDDLDTQAYIADARATLSLARDLARSDAGARSARLARAAEEGALEVELSPEARAAAEAQLAEERTRRDALLAAIALASGGDPEPTPALLAGARTVDLPDEGDAGLALARRRARGPVERRVAYAPDGSRLAAWYVDARGEAVLREDDRDGDGLPDRWSAGAGGRAREVWETRDASGVPGAHVKLAADGSVERIEVLRPTDGEPSRVFDYAGGRLVAESADTNGDGRLDRFERFDAGGEVASREEDLDGDGEIDVRSRYEKGRLVRREITDPSLVESMLPR